MKQHPNIDRSGKYAVVRYRGGAQNEEIVDDHFQEPTRIRIGVGEVPRGIDEALYQMEIGETRTVIIPPEKAYGHHDPAGVHFFQRSTFPNGKEIHIGFTGKWRNPITQRFIPAICTKETEDYVQIDFNHPLAGKTLQYEISLIDIEDYEVRA